MVRSIVVFAMAALLAGVALAKGGGGGYYYISIPAGQPGNACIPDGVGSGQETKTSDGTPVLASGVHGANSSRCPNPQYPNLATTQKLAPDEVRNAPSAQCVSQGVQVGDEVPINAYGRATVLEVNTKSNKCTFGVEVTVISTAAYRASKAAQTPEPATSQPATRREPTEAEIQQEYDRILAAAAPVKEFHVRHILVHRREDAVSALQRIKSGTPFGDVAADVSIDTSSRSKGGDLGWTEPRFFIDEFSKAMVSLEPAGLTAEPVHTRFGWHVIEVLETQMGRATFPPLSDVRDRIATRLKKVQESWPKVGAKAVCRKMVTPEVPAEAARDGAKGTVVAEMRVENGKVAAILSLSGPSIFHPAVIEAVNKYECDRLDRAVIATQSFDF